VTSHRLRLNVGKRGLKQLGVDEFVWLPRGEGSSMATTVGPHLEELGRVPTLHKDLVHLAVSIFLADRSSHRNRGTGVRWERDLDLIVPVTAPGRWNSVSQQLEEHLHTLTGDRWSLTFEKQSGRRPSEVADVRPADVVCLFSGGADSLAGAIAARDAVGAPPVLVSHWDFNKIGGVQSDLVDRLEQVWGTPIEHHRIQMQRLSHQVGSGLAFPNEIRRRSRSFLFLALGLAAAAVRGAELWICENGFTSVNPPLSPERRGSLTTRTTHPGFLDGVTETLQDVGLSVTLTNPFEAKTKGMVLAEAASKLKVTQAKDLFSASHSCGKPARFPGFSSGDQCGVCFGCVVRRGSFLASGIQDETPYIETQLRGKRNRDAFLTPTRRKSIEAVRYRLARGYDASDILRMGLPARFSVEDALQVVRDGLEELRPVVDSIP
jgi:7-cyano-7-deazaguanine synthase in queuosine biosynthesis